MARYEISDLFVEENQQKIKDNEEQEFNLQDTEMKSWVRGKGILSFDPIEGGEEIGVLRSYGGSSSKVTSLYVKLIGDPEEADELIADTHTDNPHH